MADERLGWVYFVLATQSNIVKVGWTIKHPKTRLAQLQVGSPEPLTLLGVVAGNAALDALKS